MFVGLAHINVGHCRKCQWECNGSEAPKQSVMTKQRETVFKIASTPQTHQAELSILNFKNPFSSNSPNIYFHRRLVSIFFKFRISVKISSSILINNVSFQQICKFLKY